MNSQAGQISEEGDLFAKKGHLCEKVQVRTGLQNHHGVFLAINNAVEQIEFGKGTHGEFLFLWIAIPTFDAAQNIPVTHQPTIQLQRRVTGSLLSIFAQPGGI